MATRLHWANTLTIVVYLLTVVAVGAWFSRPEDTSEEYLPGGRRMPWWAVGISYGSVLLRSPIDDRRTAGLTLGSQDEERNGT